MLESEFEEKENKLVSGGTNEKFDLTEVVGYIITEQSEKKKNKRNMNVVCFGLCKSNVSTVEARSGTKYGQKK